MNLESEAVSFNPKPEAMARVGMDRPRAAPAIAFGFGLNDDQCPLGNIGNSSSMLRRQGPRMATYNTICLSTLQSEQQILGTEPTDD